MKKVFVWTTIFGLIILSGCGETPQELRGKMKVAMVDLKTIGSALMSYLVDHAKLPDVQSLPELKKVKMFVPYYIKVLPVKDPWGNDYLIKIQGEEYWLGCAGNDGKFQGFDQTGAYSPDDIAEGKDIIYQTGVFVYGPRYR